ncbi:MAG TPA: NusG domain II-containing protein [Pseudogulbenkiania sp.]|jgi:hypothetical protein|nr:NusG domain II-containing protein [Pseudogulbenkiania sp.]
MSRLIRPGDWLVLLGGVVLTGWLAWQLWGQGQARSVTIRAGGQRVASLSLLHNRLVPVPGPLGVTLVEIAGGRARIKQDPSPRQYCVHQGWLSRSGQVAICLPNATSIELTGPDQPYDSLNF